MLVLGLIKRVDEVLFYIWDPIGVSPDPCARAEYRSYVSKVTQLVQQGGDADHISNHLLNITKTIIGLSGNKTKCDEVAELLLSHKMALEEGLA